MTARRALSGHPPARPTKRPRLDAPVPTPTALVPSSHPPPRGKPSNIFYNDVVVETIASFLCWHCSGVEYICHAHADRIPSEKSPCKTCRGPKTMQLALASLCLTNRKAYLSASKHLLHAPIATRDNYLRLVETLLWAGGNEAKAAERTKLVRCLDSRFWSSRRIRLKTAAAAAGFLGSEANRPRVVEMLGAETPNSTMIAKFRRFTRQPNEERFPCPAVAALLVANACRGLETIMVSDEHDTHRVLKLWRPKGPLKTFVSSHPSASGYLLEDGYHYMWWGAPMYGVVDTLKVCRLGVSDLPRDAQPNRQFANITTLELPQARLLLAEFKGIMSKFPQLQKLLVHLRSRSGDNSADIVWPHDMSRCLAACSQTLTKLDVDFTLRPSMSAPRSPLTSRPPQPYDDAMSLARFPLLEELSIPPFYCGAVWTDSSDDLGGGNDLDDMDHDGRAPFADARGDEVDLAVRFARLPGRTNLNARQQKVWDLQTAAWREELYARMLPESIRRLGLGRFVLFRALRRSFANIHWSVARRGRFRNLDTISCCTFAARSDDEKGNPLVYRKAKHGVWLRRWGQRFEEIGVRLIVDGVLYSQCPRC